MDLTFLFFQNFNTQKLLNYSRNTSWKCEVLAQKTYEKIDFRTSFIHIMHLYRKLGVYQNISLWLRLILIQYFIVIWGFVINCNYKIFRTVILFSVQALVTPDGGVGEGVLSGPFVPLWSLYTGERPLRDPITALEYCMGLKEV